MSLFGTWLEETDVLQRETYGNDLRSLRGEAWAAEVRMNVTAIIGELGELLAEIPGWKTWVTEQGPPDRIGLVRAQHEFVDVQHFMANLALLLHYDDDRLSSDYVGKMALNRLRQSRREGYDGKSDKCPGCTRALDEVGTEYREEAGRRVEVCRACGVSVN